MGLNEETAGASSDDDSTSNVQRHGVGARTPRIGHDTAEETPVARAAGSCTARQESTQTAYIPENGSVRVRFLQEPHDWVTYAEHDTDDGPPFPCNGESNCPGCSAHARTGRYRLANAIDRDTDRVIPLRIPFDVDDYLVFLFAKYGSVVDRDFELSGAGEGRDTRYDLAAGSRDQCDLSTYAPLDLGKVLDEVFTRTLGGAYVRDHDRAQQALVTRVHVMPLTPEGDDDVDEAYEFTAVDLEALPLFALRAFARYQDVDSAGKTIDAIIDEVMSCGFDAAPNDIEHLEQIEGFTENRFMNQVVLPPDDDEFGVDVKPEVAAPIVTPDVAAHVGAEEEGDWFSRKQLHTLPLFALRAVALDFGVDTRGKQPDAIIEEICAAAIWR